LIQVVPLGGKYPTVSVRAESKAYWKPGVSRVKKIEFSKKGVPRKGKLCLKRGRIERQWWIRGKADNLLNPSITSYQGESLRKMESLPTGQRDKGAP